jgi:CubicO group peptidase (beta-lactamase class C family)
MGATPRELLDIVRGKPLQFPHGTRLAYNNTGYVLLGLLIEKQSGMAYRDFVERRLFEPLAMKDSGYDDARRILPNRAQGYKRTPAGLQNADPVDASVAWSAGGFYSTTRDLIAWSVGLPRVLKKESLDLMFRVYPETLLQGMHYGYGIVLAEKFGAKLHYHGGGIGGFHTVLQTYPDRDLIIAVLSNLDSDGAGIASWALADELAAAFRKR